MIRVYDKGDLHPPVCEEFDDDVVWEALRRGILEHVKVVVVRTSRDEFGALREELAKAEHDLIAMEGAHEMANCEPKDDGESAAIEGGDVPDEDAVS